MKINKINSKKGLSMIIAYVLLVVIGISLSILVYSWLKAQIPGEEKECPEGVSLIIEDYNCNNKKINITFKNQGRFSIDGTVIRVYNETGGFRYNLASGPRIFFGGAEEGEPLQPGESDKSTFDYSEINKIKKIEVIPVRWEEEQLLCNKARIVQNINNCE